jgi:AcrR family transcriptional regulator
MGDLLPRKERCSFIRIKRTLFVASGRVRSVPSRRSVERRPLTQERIARAALDIVRECGYGAVSMRAVAERLDTGQASLYAHVRGKADLDRVMIESAWAELEFTTSGSWRDQLSADARALQAVYSRYPGLAVAAFASLPRGELLVNRLEARLEALRSSGLEPRRAQAADLAVSLLASARATEDAVIAERIAESGLTAEEWWQRARAFASSNNEARPLMSELAHYLNPDDRAWLTAELVELVLDGIEARYGVAAPSRAGS